MIIVDSRVGWGMKSLIFIVGAALFVSNVSAELSLVASYRGKELARQPVSTHDWNENPGATLHELVGEKLRGKTFGLDYELGFEGYDPKINGVPRFTGLGFQFYSNVSESTYEVVANMGEDWNFDRPEWESYNEVFDLMASRVLPDAVDYKSFVLTTTSMNPTMSSLARKTFCQFELRIKGPASTAVTITRFEKN